MSTESLTPPYTDDPSALLIVDWSWWLNKAFRVFGVDGMTSAVVGWLCAALSYQPAHVAIALDSAGETFRHKLRHPTDEAWRYKGKREPKPEDFFTVGARCTEIASLHSIPILWAEGYEADDVIATLTQRARAIGYRVWICSADKDLLSLTEEDPNLGILTGVWNNAERTIMGPRDVEAKLGVRPSQVTDWLAIAGDGADGIPGVRGLGGERAALLLRAYGTLEDALAAPLADLPSLDAQLKAETKRTRGQSEAHRDAARRPLLDARALARHHRVLLDGAEMARFSRSLTSLDCDAPIDVPWYDLPTGGFDVSALRKKYEALGFTAKAREVPSHPKPVPWAAESA